MLAKERFVDADGLDQKAVVKELVRTQDEAQEVSVQVERQCRHEGSLDHPEGPTRREWIQAKRRARREVLHSERRESRERREREQKAAAKRERDEKYRAEWEARHYYSWNA